MMKCIFIAGIDVTDVTDVIVKKDVTQSVFFLFSSGRLFVFPIEKKRPTYKSSRQ